MAQGIRRANRNQVCAVLTGSPALLGDLGQVSIIYLISEGGEHNHGSVVGMTEKELHTTNLQLCNQ